MLSHETIHAIGTAVYVVFLALFLWMHSIPRTNPGALWWAAAMLCLVGGRLAYLLLPLPVAPPQDVPVYAAINALEKALLLGGLLRFFDLPRGMRALGLATLAIELWIGLSWMAGASLLLRGVPVVAFDTAAELLAAGIALRYRREADSRWLLLTIVACVLMGLQWSLVYVIYPDAQGMGFLSGTVWTLAIYFGLLATLLRSFQRRLQQAEASALEMAFRDPLTGLNNRRYMSTLFENALLLATRPHQLVAVLCIDLDDFKAINDSAGHHAGDAVLKTVAARLIHATRSTDICARLGGDEFVVICTQLEQPEQICPIAQKLLDALAEPIAVDGRSHLPHASVGVSFYPQHGRNLAELLEHADHAMYQVKQGGKHGYCIHLADGGHGDTPVTH